jgi:hypothetical protein
VYGAVPVVTAELVKLEAWPWSIIAGMALIDGATSAELVTITGCCAPAGRLNSIPPNPVFVLHSVVQVDDPGSAGVLA